MIEVIRRDLPLQYIFLDAVEKKDAEREALRDLVATLIQSATINRGDALKALGGLCVMADEFELRIDVPKFDDYVKEFELTVGADGSGEEVIEDGTQVGDDNGEQTKAEEPISSLQSTCKPPPSVDVVTQQASTTPFAGRPAQVQPFQPPGSVVLSSSGTVDFSKPMAHSPMLPARGKAEFYYSRPPGPQTSVPQPAAQQLLEEVDPGEVSTEGSSSGEEVDPGEESSSGEEV